MTDEEREDCPCCGGTGEVHSHNPICWECKGSGKVPKSEIDRLKRAYNPELAGPTSTNSVKIK